MTTKNSSFQEYLFKCEQIGHKFLYEGKLERSTEKKWKVKKMKSIYRCGKNKFQQNVKK